MRHRGGPDRPAASGAPGPLASEAETGRGGASGAGRTGPSSQLWRDPERTGGRADAPQAPAHQTRGSWTGVGRKPDAWGTGLSQERTAQVTAGDEPPGIFLCGCSCPWVLTPVG